LDAGLRTSTDQWHVAATVKTDYRLTPVKVLTPSITVFGGRSTTDFTYDEFQSVPGGAFERTFISERLRTWSAGGRVGATVTYLATPSLRLFLGANVGAAFERSTYSGNSCEQEAPVGDCFSPGAIGFARGAATDSRSTVAFLAGANIGARYSF